jgi:hypothetical protein
METEEERRQEPICSVLNVVIDFTMEPPCPLEPEEFLQVYPHPSLPPQKGSTKDSFFGNDSSHQDRRYTNKTTTATTGGGVVGAIKGNHQLLVPVIRVFGPILRRRGGSGVEGTRSFCRPPQQSCCLYIHGAYPYLLARPRQAGPDGSLSHGTVPSGHVNWDSVDSIERIASHIGATLEAAIQAFTPFETNYHNNTNNTNTNNSSTNKKQPFPARSQGGGVKAIRRVTVVQGRGFYTYCPGPPAPFLRIEYYDPKLRWKVKTVLERGLELPDLYHPPPEQYHYFQCNNNNAEQNDDDGVPLPPPPPEELLRFHCYEAHIPYTMQFFKDWNLSGMSYIHLTNGKFRGPLPVHAKRLDEKHEDTNHHIDDDTFFLQSNTSSDFVWSPIPNKDADFSNSVDGSATDDLLPMALLHQCSHPSSQSTIVSTVAHDDETAYDGTHKNLLVDNSTSIFTTAALLAAASAGVPPPPKETSCHLEFDCTVQDIWNVQTVIHSMPTEQEERDRIQWRAVPSLQEIWRQERLRMSKLLPPEDDFLSFPNGTTTPVTSQATTTQEGEANHNNGTRNKRAKTPPFTLNVKKGASRPGARLAAKGMWSLVNVTMGLQGDFVRALSQIVRRHRQTVWEMDHALMRLKEEHPAPTVCTSRLLFQNSDDFDDEMSTASAMVHTQLSNEPLTPTMDEAIEALGALAGQHETPIQSLTPTLDEAIEALGGLAGQFETDDAVSTTCLSSTPVEDERSSHSHHVEDLILSSSEHNDDIDSPTVSSSQGMQFIQGQTYDSSQDSDAIANDNGQEDFSNPNRTLIYQSSQDLHEHSRTTTMQMTQEVATWMDPMEYSQRGESSPCSSALGNDDDNLEDCIDPETLLPYEELYFGEARCLVKFIVQTDAPGTMRLCGASALGCTRKGHQVSHDRARPGYYRTITTGNIVDGLILPTGLENPGVFSADSPATQCDEDDEEEDDDQFEHVLSMLATQIPSSQSEKPTKQQFTPYSQDEGEEEMEEIGYDAADKGATPWSQRLTVAGGESSNEETSHLGDVHGQPFKDSDCHESICSDDHKISDFLSPNSIDTEETIHGNTACNSTDSTPKRLDDTSYDSTKYSALRSERKKNPELPSSNLFQLVGREGKNYVQPVTLPPTSRQVGGWYKQKFGSSAEHPNWKENAMNSKKRRREPEGDGLEIDGNSRKLVPRAGGNMGRAGDAQGVEEVQWEFSQLTQHLAESQQTPPDACGDAPTDEPQKLESRNALVRSIDSGEAPPHESKTMESSSIIQSQSASQNSDQPLDGIGNQGGRIHVQGGGGLKARTRPSQATTPTKEAQMEDGVPNHRYEDFLPSPISFMSIEIHVQCRTGASRLDGQKIAMTPDSSKDKVFAIVYIYGRDPSGGELLQILERGCLFVPLETESANRAVQIAHIRSSIPRATMGVSGKLSVECLNDEKSMLLRLASIVRMKDPDMLMSWDTQGSGLGYLIERGIAMAKDGRHHDDTSSVCESGTSSLGLDMARLLGRLPHSKKVDSFAMGTPIGKSSTGGEAKVAGQDTLPGDDGKWKGSGLGKDWDDSVGAGAAAASIVSLNLRVHSEEALISHF